MTFLTEELPSPTASCAAKARRKKKKPFRTFVPAPQRLYPPGSWFDGTARVTEANLAARAVSATTSWAPIYVDIFEPTLAVGEWLGERRVSVAESAWRLGAANTLRSTT